MILLPFFMIVGAFWRRWYGGGFGKLGDITRFWKYLLMAGIVLSMYYVKSLLDWQDWRMYAVIASFAYHWARSHGDYFYIYDTGKDEGRIKWIDRVLRLIYGEDGYYNFKGNVTGMLLRYGFTAIIVACCIPNPWFLLAGPCVAACYGLSGYLFPNRWYTKIAEFASGATVFSLLYLCL